ncbi:MAG TPA: hypothetical protein G4N94_08050 [Caldilineae bacterium]|nr:hypothetical protein [Caldilineae bacterium]
MKKWKFVNIVPDGQTLVIGGVNVWKHEWRSIDDDPIIVPHPSYPNQRHKMWLYKIETGAKKIVFAAGEYSAGVWGFYIPV